MAVGGVPAPPRRPPARTHPSGPLGAGSWRRPLCPAAPPGLLPSPPVASSLWLPGRGRDGGRLPPAAAIARRSRAPPRPAAMAGAAAPHGPGQGPQGAPLSSTREGWGAAGSLIPS